MALLRGSDSTCYGYLLLNLANQFAAGGDHYPKDLMAAYSLRLAYKLPTNTQPRNDNDNQRNNQHSSNTSNPAGSSNVSTPWDSRPIFLFEIFSILDGLSN
jgi:hypothetical protein